MGWKAYLMGLLHDILHRLAGNDLALHTDIDELAKQEEHTAEKAAETDAVDAVEGKEDTTNA